MFLCQWFLSASRIKPNSSTWPIRPWLPLTFSLTTHSTHYSSTPPPFQSSDMPRSFPTQVPYICCFICLGSFPPDHPMNNYCWLTHTFKKYYWVIIRFLLKCHLPPRILPWLPSNVVKITPLPLPPPHVHSLAPYLALFSCLVIITTSHFLF